MSTFDPKFLNQLINCDCVKGMCQLPDESIVFTLTSPPYDKIRKYGGHAFDFESIASQLWRITAQGGVVVWVVADQVNAKGSLTGTKHKQLLYFLDLGFSLRNELTLTTTNTGLPQKTRYTQTSHTAFVLAKGRPRTVSLLRDKPNTSVGKFKKNWTARSEDGTLRRGYYGKHIAPFGQRSDVWTYTVGGIHTTKDKISHPDKMAEAMAEDLILSFSRPGDVVFDPMAGSGTTCKMALLNHRSYLGMEIHGPYWQEAVERLTKNQDEYKKRLDNDLSPNVLVPPPALPRANGHVFEVPTIVFPRKAEIAVKHADVLKTLKELGDNSFDGAFGDPPYALTSIVNRYGKENSKPPKTEKGPNGVYGRIARGFMGKEWDGALPSVEVWQELLRVCKPGAILLAFGHPRTDHRLKASIEDSGWIIRDTMMWLHGTGMPKSRDFSKDIDRILGAERAKVLYPPRTGGTFSGNGDHRPWVERSHRNGLHEAAGPIPVTLEAAQWIGYGTALKPAYEPIIVAMKPYKGSFAKNAIACGVAGLNIDGCRIGPRRFPTNIILDEEAGRLLDMQGPVSKGGSRDLSHNGKLLYGGGIGGGVQNVPDTYGDAGGISRFFYCPKASKRERNEGLKGLPIKRPDERDERAMGMWDKHGIQPQQNHHPAVKPLALCRYLATLIMPPKRETPRKVIVPYAGSGSELIGAMMAGWDEVLGVELDPEYVEIAERRIAHWRKGVRR